MSVLKKTRVIMLPSKEKANLILGGANKLYFAKLESTFRSIQNASYQHLYFLSDEEIKEGNWGIDIETNQSLHFEGLAFSGLKCLVHNTFKKIIASTDTSLSHFERDDEIKGLHHTIYLPQPSESFIQAYIKAYNEGKQITEVMVEYETMNSGGINSGLEPLRLKIAKDNTITIKKIKDYWSREEVIALYREASKHATGCSCGDVDEILLWIEENL